VMLVSRSGYYAWRTYEDSALESENLKFVPLVRELHRQSGGTYGTLRIADDLRKQGVPCGRIGRVLSWLWRAYPCLGEESSR